jgi:hypothetical protein
VVLDRPQEESQMTVSPDIAYYSIAGLVGAGAAFGMLKAKVKESMTFQQHSKLCAAEREETRKQLEDFRCTLNETAQMVAQIHGYLKGMNGGSL